MLLQFTSMWNITGTRIHLNTRGSEPWAQGSLIPGSNYSAQVILAVASTACAMRSACRRRGACGAGPLAAGIRARVMFHCGRTRAVPACSCVLHGRAYLIFAIRATGRPRHRAGSRLVSCRLVLATSRHRVPCWRMLLDSEHRARRGLQSAEHPVSAGGGGALINNDQCDYLE